MKRRRGALWRTGIAVVGASLVFALRASAADPTAGVVTGQLEKWGVVTVSFAGPKSSEAAKVNPFRDYRLMVVFAHGSRQTVVPGYFAADGEAAETGAAAGNCWRAHFRPDETGAWRYTASFRNGEDIAASLDPDAGRPVWFDGAQGQFDVAPRATADADPRGRGMLQYVGERYLKFAETGEYFLKGGADSPENFLAYREFDGTPAQRRAEGPSRKGEAKKPLLHRYEPHIRDWRTGDPLWRGDRGKGIIGGLNYLASKGVNSVYFLTMNVGGDGDDVWPWTDRDERYRFDCSKLDQWEIVFSHMDRLGVMLHVVTQETENDQLLDGGQLGVQRRLYYRELVARFAHHSAVVWNLGEENTNTDQQRKLFAKHLHDLDPYDHPVVVHTFGKNQDEVYGPLLGYQYFEGTSLQTNDGRNQTIRWVDRSAAAGRPWVVTLDEIGPASTGVRPDAEDIEHDEERKRYLWGTLMAGGAGVEWYFGYKYPHNDLNCEDWRSRDRLWDVTRYALEFFREHLPFATMRRADVLTPNPNDYCFAAPGRVYAIYLPEGGAASLHLGNTTAPFDVQWYDPRHGGPLVRGAVESVRGPGVRPLGGPPRDPGEDWVVLVQTQQKAALRKLGVRGGLGGGLYPAGAAVPVTAQPPDDQQVFDRWTGARELVHDATKAETFVVLPDANATLVATFKRAPAAAVTGFTLIDAETRQPVPGFNPIPNGAVMDLGKLPARLNILANVSGARIGSIRFDWDDKPGYRTENVAPFALAGDTGGGFGAVTLAPGEHVLKATVYSQRGGAGSPGEPLAVRFTVVGAP